MSLTERESIFVDALISLLSFNRIFFFRTPIFGAPYLRDVWKSDHIRHQTDDRDEDLSSAPENFGELVHQGGDEAFHGAELKETRGSRDVCVCV